MSSSEFPSRKKNPPPPHTEKSPASIPEKKRHRTLAEIVNEVRTFLEKDIPARNRLGIDRVMGISEKDASKIQTGLQGSAAHIERRHAHKRGGESISIEQEMDHLLELLIVAGMHYDVKSPSSNFGFLGQEGDAFTPDLLHDLKYRTDGIGVLPVVPGKTANPIVFRFDACTGSEIGPMKKFWTILYEITKNGHMGHVPFVSIDLRGGLSVTAGGLVGAPRVILAASRSETMRFARKFLELSEAVSSKQALDIKDPSQSRSIGRRRVLEKIEEDIRTDELQLQLVVQMIEQWKFYREFSIMHKRRIDGAIHRNEIGAPHISGAGGQWGTCGVEIPHDAPSLRILQSNLGDTIAKLQQCIYATESVRDELMVKVRLAEKAAGLAPRKRHKGHARHDTLEQLAHSDSAHCAVIALVSPENRALQQMVSNLHFSDLGLKAPPKTE